MEGKKLQTQRLNALEETIADGKEKAKEGFFAIAGALTEIKKDQLYRVKGYKTFEEYCHDKHQLSRQYAYRLINAESIRELLSAIDGKFYESHFRELGRLKNSNDIKEIAYKVVNAGPVTAQKIREAVQIKLVETLPEKSIPRPTSVEDDLALYYSEAIDAAEKLLGSLCDIEILREGLPAICDQVHVESREELEKLLKEIREGRKSDE